LETRYFSTKTLFFHKKKGGGGSFWYIRFDILFVSEYFAKGLRVEAI